ncbi:MAG: hypothetical protein ACXW3Z_08005 [Limisphaerales bacterium]
MRARALLRLLWVSLGLNILLAILIARVSSTPERSSVAPAPDVQAKAETNAPRTHVVVRRQGFAWSEVESADFPTYIKNLRNIGCPERTIRDIIVAEVNELFAERLTRELNLPEQKWWLPDPDMDALQSGMDQVRTLEAEKSLLLTQLLGAGWESQKSAVASGTIRFDGPVLSKLPAEARTSVERIEANSRRFRTEIQERARQENRSVTEQELARLRQETRRELAAVLDPAQMEEYLLRYSQTADEMREQLRGYGADADEFRRIFRVRDSFDQQIAALGDDPASAARRVEISRLRDDALRQAVGGERFGLYQASQSPLFREAQEQAEQRGAPADKVMPIFRVNQAVQDEIARIQADQTISEDQRRIALVTVQQQQRNSIERILGNEPAEEIVETPQPSRTLPAAPPPLPPFPEVFDAARPPRELAPPGTDLPPGVNQTTKGPVNPRRR